VNWKAIKVWMCSQAVYLYLLLIYRHWSRLYRWLFERQYKDQYLATYRTWKEIVTTLKKMTWKRDSWRQLFDAISYPGKVERILQWNLFKEVGDCDEFAIWLVAIIKKAIYRCSLENYYGLRPLDAFFLTVTWMAKDGKLGGHNVCLIEWVDLDTHVDIDYSYMDYQYPSKSVGSINKVVEQVLEKYGGEGAVCLGWAVHDQNLNLMEIHKS